MTRSSRAIPGRVLWAFVIAIASIVFSTSRAEGQAVGANGSAAPEVVAPTPVPPISVPPVTPAPAPAPRAPEGPRAAATGTPATPVPAAAAPVSASPAPAAGGPTAAAPPAPVAGRFDDQKIRRNSSDPAAPATPGTPAQTPSGSGASDIIRIVAALAIVIGVIFALRWASRKFFAMPAAARTSAAVQVLSRSMLSPKHQVVLLRVGKRLLLVGDGGAQLNTLCELTDPDEVAAILGQLQTEKQTAAGKTFAAMFSKLKKGFAKDEDEEESKPQHLESPARPAGKLDVMAGDLPDRDEAETDEEEDDPRPTTTEKPDSSVVACTRDELGSLMKKIRLVSKQFQKGT